MTLTNCQTNAP